MTIESATSQPTCQGCCLNPNWQWPYLTHNPFNCWNQSPIMETLPLQPCYTFLPAEGLTSEELDVLTKLKDSWNAFILLDKRSEPDYKEFQDAIHRCQQLIALRVARRVNPDVWAQPNE